MGTRIPSARHIIHSIPSDDSHFAMTNRTGSQEIVHDCGAFFFLFALIFFPILLLTYGFAANVCFHFFPPLPTKKNHISPPIKLDLTTVGKIRCSIQTNNYPANFPQHNDFLVIYPLSWYLIPGAQVPRSKRYGQAQDNTAIRQKQRRKNVLG